MAFSAAIIAKLELAMDSFQRGLQKAEGDVVKFGDKSAAALEKKFSGADLFRGILQGIGIASVQQIADRLVAPFRESAESAQRIADYSDRAADATERLLAARRSDTQQLAALEKQYARIAAEAQKPADLGVWKAIGIAIMAGPVFALQKLKEARDELTAEKQAKAAAEMGEKALQIEEQKDRIKKRRVQEDRQRDEEERRGLNEINRNAREREGAARSLADFEKEQRRAKLSDEELINNLTKEKRGIDKQIAEYEKFTREGGELTADGARELLALKQQQLKIEGQIVEATDRKAKGEQAIGKEVESNIAKWKDLKIAIDSTGRGDRDLSDRELARKQAEIRKDISLREAALLTSGGVFTGASAQDPFLSAQRSNLGQLLAEQQLRQKVRREAGFFGEDAAFARNPGLTEQRFRQILEGRGPANDERFLTAIERLERQLGRPLQAVVIATAPGVSTG